eukprot:3316765-Rhodomonas_salina.4
MRILSTLSARISRPRLRLLARGISAAIRLGESGTELEYAGTRRYNVRLLLREGDVTLPHPLHRVPPYAPDMPCPDSSVPSNIEEKPSSGPPSFPLETFTPRPNRFTPRPKDFTCCPKLFTPCAQIQWHTHCAPFQPSFAAQFTVTCECRQ